MGEHQMPFLVVPGITGRFNLAPESLGQAAHSSGTQGGGGSKVSERGDTSDRRELVGPRCLVEHCVGGVREFLRPAHLLIQQGLQGSAGYLAGRVQQDDALRGLLEPVCEIVEATGPGVVGCLPPGEVVLLLGVRIPFSIWASRSASSLWTSASSRAAAR